MVSQPEPCLDGATAKWTVHDLDSDRTSVAVSGWYRFFNPEPKALKVTGWERGNFLATDCNPSEMRQGFGFVEVQK